MKIQQLGFRLLQLVVLWIVFGAGIGFALNWGHSPTAYAGRQSFFEPKTPGALSSMNTLYMVKDILAGSGSSEPTFGVVANDTLFFVPSNIRPLQLWKSDGSDAGTSFISFLNNGWFTEGSPVNVGGTVYFMIRNGQQVYEDELWKSDGTITGTLKVTNNTICSTGICLAYAGKTVYFSAKDQEHGLELWKTDGTPEGTVMVKDINPGSASSNPLYFYNLNEVIYFGSNDGVHGGELWKTDGTPEGTVMVKDINPGSASSIPGPYDWSFIMGSQNKLFFTARTPQAGMELWTSDGTITGTVMLKDINPGPGDSVAGLLTDLDGTLYFGANDGTAGGEIWKTNGEPQGTEMVKDIYPGSTGSNPSDMVVLNHFLYFRADDGVHGRELWKSDGSANNTAMVQDINSDQMGYPYLISSDPMYLTVFHRSLYFVAQYDWHQNTAVYQLDPDSLPTALINTKDPRVLAHNGQTKLFFSINDGVHGTELWALQFPRTIFLPSIMR